MGSVDVRHHLLSPHLRAFAVQTFISFIFSLCPPCPLWFITKLSFLLIIIFLYTNWITIFT